MLSSALGSSEKTACCLISVHCSKVYPVPIALLPSLTKASTVIEM